MINQYMTCIIALHYATVIPLSAIQLSTLVSSIETTLPDSNDTTVMTSHFVTPDTDKEDSASLKSHSTKSLQIKINKLH